MAERAPEMRDRRAVLGKLAALGVAPVALPLLPLTLDALGATSISSAVAADFPGAAMDEGDLSYISGAAAPTSQIAEWYDSGATPGNGFRIAATKAAFGKAPASSSHYDAKLYAFPSGALRTLRFNKNRPSFHLITFETIIYVLSGTATLTPLDNHPGKPVSVRAGDALFLPSGVLSNPKPSEELVILQGFVERTVRNAKKSIVTSAQAHAAAADEWQAANGGLRAKTYAFDGNTLRVLTLKGSRSAHVAPQSADVLIYLASGKALRKEGNHVAQIVAGDCVRERVGSTAEWTPIAETVLIAIDARLDPAMLPPDQTV